MIPALTPHHLFPPSSHTSFKRILLALVTAVLNSFKLTLLTIYNMVAISYAIQLELLVEPKVEENAVPEAL